MKVVGTNEVAEGMYALLERHPELRQEVAMAAEAEPAAIAILKAAAADDWAPWHRAREIERQTAGTLFLAFFADISFPRQYGYANATWEVQDGPPEKVAWQVVVAEIERSHPQQARPH